MYCYCRFRDHPEELPQCFDLFSGDRDRRSCVAGAAATSNVELLTWTIAVNLEVWWDPESAQVEPSTISPGDVIL